jgi:transmembrane sensor
VTLSPEPTDVRAIEVEAGAWIAQLDKGEFSEADRAALREWCARSKAHREAIGRLGGIWAELEALGPFMKQMSVASATASSPIERLRWSPFWAAHAAAAAVVVIGVSMWLVNVSSPQLHDPPVQLYETSIGEQRTIVLADHSTMRLNTNTLVEVDYRVRERRVRLVKGEALFDVAKDHTRPFIVYAGADTVRAVGTRFSVRLQQENVEVVVSEGQVAFSRAVVDSRTGGVTAQTSVLRQKQTAWIDDRASTPIEITTIGNKETERRLSWATGVLEFNGEPLEKVVAEITRYTPLHIRIAQPELRRMPVGGRFRVGDTEALFDAVRASFGVRVIYDADGVLLTY